VAQERNEIGPFDSRAAREARGPLAQGGGNRETEQIKSEIERTAVEMSETLGEIQERLRPDHLIQQAKDTVADAATGKVRNIMHSAGETAAIVADQTRYAGQSVADYVRTHPVQMALVAGGVTWWLLRGRDRSDDWAGASEGWREADRWRDSEDYGDGQTLRERAGEYAATARDKVTDLASTARETAGEYAESARYAAGQASERARDAAERARYAARLASMRARDGWQRASTSVDDWVHEYPLAAGAVAIAVGAAIGLSVPGTEFENRTLGERRDQALERARSAARDLANNVSQKAQDVADTVMDVAGGTNTTTASSSTTTGSSQGRA
jgi:ElaB/YqjD/DUF883 family membrane-anchored ribosome-binding protein